MTRFKTQHVIMPRSAFPFQYGRYGQDEYQPITFDPQTGEASGTGIGPAPTPATGGGGGQIPYYLAASGTPSDQIDWSTAYTQPTGYDPDLVQQQGGGGTSSGAGSAAGSFFTSLLSGLFKSVGGAGTPVAPKPVVQQQGFPTWAIVLGGIGALGVVAILLKK